MKNNLNKTILLIFTFLLSAGCIQDNLEEFESEEFVFSNGTTVTIGNPGSVRASFLGQSSSGQEGEMVDIVVFLDKAHSSPVQITADITSGNAGANIDYTAIASAVSIPAGQTQGTLKYFLLADQVNEQLENFYISLRSLTPGVLVSSAPHMINIINKAADTPAPPTPGNPAVDSVVSLAATVASVSEAQGLYSIPVILDKATAKNISVTLSTTGSAVLGQDYVLVNGTTLNIPAGAMSGSILIQIIDDTAVESAENVTLSLQAAMGGTLGANKSLVLTIADNDMAAPVPPAPGMGQDELTAFRETLYNNILRNANTGRCLNCHRPNGTSRVVSPFHSHDDAATALLTIKSAGLVNLTNPGASVLVDKVASGHQSWSGQSQTDSDAIRAQIEAWVARMAPPSNPGTPTPPPVNQGNRIVSSALSVSEGEAVEGTSRYATNQIAFYDFKKGADDKIIYDKSNVAPAMNLTITGDIEWSGGQGIKCNQNATNGRAVATAANSRKLHTRITASDQYTIEAWLSSTDPAQDGPTRIVTYSRDSQNRNFTMGQSTEYFSFRGRNAETGNNGAAPEYEPQVKFISSRPVNHHVVMVYDGKGRKIYVNGALVEGKDAADNGANKNLDSWNNGYQFGFCNEIQNNVVRAFKGSIYMAAVFDRALTPAQIMQNYDAGFTKKLALSFDISEHTNPGARLSTQVEVQGKYLIFSKPQFKGLTAPVNVSAIEFSINNQKALGAQSYAFIDHASIGNNTDISDVAALIVANDIGSDKVSVSFGELAGKANIVAPVLFPYEGNNVNVQAAEITPESGIKLFSEINQTFANITGVATSTQTTRELFEELKTGLPTDKGIDTFSSSQQINIVKLAYEYCKIMISNQNLRSGFYGNISTSQNASGVFNNTVRSQVSDAIIDKAIGRDIASQPSSAEVTQNINSLITELIGQGKTTDEVLTGACVVGLGNMSVLVK